MHRWSKLFIPTLREAPADAEVPSHKFLVRAGYVRQLAAGIYSYLFLGRRALNKIAGIVRQEMDQIGQEFYLPGLNPREIWEASGRWEQMGDTMFRLKDRKGADLCLGMTHEEVMTEIARKELRSYKQLPQIWYQIQTKFRDEARPKSGLMRVRQFIMKDSYSFDLDEKGLDASYLKHYDAYSRIFDRAGLKYVVVEAHSGAMGGSQSHEFMVMTDAGEDLVVSCAQCRYAANLEKASSRLDPVEELKPSGDGKPELVATPGKRTIEEVSKFLGVSPKNKIKTLALVATEEEPGQKQPKQRNVIVLLRGDHSLNEAKLQTALGGKPFRPMQPEEIEKLFGAPAGYIGPVGLAGYQPGARTTPTQQILLESLPIILADEALKGRQNLVTGANKSDHHLRNVTPGRDFGVSHWADLRSAEAGEPCPKCGEPLRVAKAVEIGHIFKLGDRYARSMGAVVLDQDGKEITPIMGSYGIGLERILTAAVEQNHDTDGFWLPTSIAPFHVLVTPTNVGDAAVLAAAGQVAEALEAAGYDVLLDDRDERPGVKFKDADLVGIPFRVTVGKKVSEGKVELLRRSTRESQDATISDIAGVFHNVFQAGG